MRGIKVLAVVGLAMALVGVPAQAQQNAPYEEAFEMGDFQSDYDLIPDFEGEEGFYLADEQKAKGKELWLSLDTIVIVMHSGMETDLLGLAGDRGSGLSLMSEPKPGRSIRRVNLDQRAHPQFEVIRVSYVV